jgi:hypothetical protein
MPSRSTLATLAVFHRGRTWTRQADSIEAAIERAEQQLGVGPLNRLKLGLIVSESVKTLAELNAEAEDDCGAYDIRLAAVPDVEKEKPGFLSTEPVAASADSARSAV